MTTVEKTDTAGSRRKFALDTAEVKNARRFVSSFLVEAGMEPLVADAELAVSELFGNAVMHSQGATAAEVVIVPSRSDVRIEVRDDGKPPDHDVAQHDPSPLEPSGRGLMVVGMLADRWGVERGAAGTSVWFELELRR
jgi:anti-sigma regulatory factor (Ser/Thr protein kinase)